MNHGYCYKCIFWRPKIGWCYFHKIKQRDPTLWCGEYKYNKQLKNTNI